MGSEARSDMPQGCPLNVAILGCLIFLTSYSRGSLTSLKKLYLAKIKESNHSHHSLHHPVYKSIRIGCRWDGTAPFCEGSCDQDEIMVKVSTEGDGMPCWTGIKKKCCKRLKW